jgi:spore germination protein YaaH
MKKKFLFIIFILIAFTVPKTGFAIEKIFYLPQFNAVKGVESLKQNWQKVDILAPQMHTLSFTGNTAKITGGFGPELKKIIKEHNIKVMPLIANANFSQPLMHKLLTLPIQQDRVIAGLVYLAKRDGYIGWQFDFENISYKDRDLFSAFAQKTYKEFKKNNLLFSVVAVPRTTDFEDTKAFKNWSGVYDYKLLAENSDFISLMVYDDPNSVGPVASLDFVNKSLKYMEDKIPPEKLSLGVPLYYWKWDQDTNKKLGSGLFKNVLAIISNFQHTIKFDAKLGVSSLSYSYNNKNYKIWFEDDQSLQAKLDIIKNNKLRGFSAWLLGGEDPDIWKIL